MKIYFAGSIQGGREDGEVYLKLIEYLKKYGKVLTEHVGNLNLVKSVFGVLTDSGIWEKDVSWLKEADIVVAEVSTPSLGVGYEIGRAEELGKMVLCLFRPQEGKKLSPMIAGNKNLVVKKYNDLEEAFKIIDEFFANMK